MAYDPLRGRIWATLPSNAAGGNSLTDIDPVNGTAGSPIFVGSEPGPMGISDDGSTLYVGLSGARAVRRIDLTTRTPGLQFTPRDATGDTVIATDIAVQPGSNDVIAMTSGSPFSSGTEGPSIYDNGVRRPLSLGIYQGSYIAWTSPSRLVTFNAAHTGAELIEANVTAEGATKGLEVRNGLGAFSRCLVRAGNRLYGSEGSIVDENTLLPIGRFTFQSSGTEFFGPAVDTNAGLAFFMEVGNGEVLIHSYRLDTFLKVGTNRLKNVSSAQSSFQVSDVSLMRWGAKGLAFRTVDRVYLIDQVPGF